jgi:hypothetical protein
MKIQSPHPPKTRQNHVVTQHQKDQEWPFCAHNLKKMLQTKPFIRTHPLFQVAFLVAFFNPPQFPAEPPPLFLY